MPEAIADAPADTSAAAPAAAVEDLGDPFSAYGGATEETVTQPADDTTKPPASDKRPVSEPLKKEPTTEKPDVTKNPEDTTTKPDKKTEEVSPERMQPKQLRQAYDESKKRLATLEKELTETKAKLTTSNPAEIEEAKKSVAAAQEKLTTLQKRNEELESEMRFVDYEKSTEFQEQYHKPYVALWENAKSTVEGLKVPGPDGAIRAGTFEDLLEVIRAGSIDEAVEIAERIFGNPTKANLVLGLREQIRNANNQIEQAKHNFKTQGAERFKQQAEQKQKQFESDAGTFRKLSQEAIEKFPQWFKADDTDAKGKEILEKGMALADQAFSGNLDPAKRLALHAAIRNKAGAFDYMVHKNRGLSARVAELEKELADFRKSDEPGKSDVGTERADDDLGDPFKKFQ